MTTNKKRDGYNPQCMTNGWYESRISELESLVRDMTKLNHCNIGGECAICTVPSLCDVPKRVRELGIDTESGV